VSHVSGTMAEAMVPNGGSSFFFFFFSALLLFPIFVPHLLCFFFYL